ncbi:DUF2933 domain-containing protein [Thermodesulfobacteriota bacterium]
MKKLRLGSVLQNHSFAMILCCAIPLGLIGILSFTGALGSWGFYGLMLLCPILHFLMMRGHTSHTHDRNENGLMNEEPKKLLPAPPATVKDQQVLAKESYLDH